MAQPSVAAYFNTRKRVAVDDLKINRVKKVLITDDENGKVIPKDLVDFLKSNVEVEQHKTINGIDKIVSKRSSDKHHNKVESSESRIQKVESVQMAKSTTKNGIRSATPKRKILKGQQTIQKFVTKVSLNESEGLENVTHNIRELSTPPSSPEKKKNAMDKVSDMSISSLDSLKMKMCRSKRLAELKASITRFNDSQNKLKEIEKTTSKISVDANESPKLKNFKSLELEVNLSPQKIQSPEKQYLSPKKDASARKNLLNLLNPTKNAIPSCYSIPVKKIDENSLKSGLTLPFKYRYIAEMFRSIDTVSQLLFNRKEMITLSKLKPAVEKMTKRNLTLQCLRQIKNIYPQAYSFQCEKVRIFGSGKKEDKWDLVLNPICDDADRLTSDALLNRRRTMFSLLLDKVKSYHQEFLLSLEPPLIIPKDEITRWHPEFDIEKVPDIEESKLPEATEEQALITGQEVLQKARKMFRCYTRMEEAIDRLKAKNELTNSNNVDDDVPSTSILKGIPKVLLEKVRQKQAAKAMILMTRSADKDKEIQIYSRLPGLVRLIRNLFVSNKKDCLPLDYVIEKLENSSFLTSHEIHMKEFIEILSRELPQWLFMIKNSDNKIYVKVDRMADLSIVINKLEESLKIKGNVK